MMMMMVNYAKLIRDDSVHGDCLHAVVLMVDALI